jgi:hypothetical protein
MAVSPERLDRQEKREQMINISIPVQSMYAPETNYRMHAHPRSLLSMLLLCYVLVSLLCLLLFRCPKPFRLSSLPLAIQNWILRHENLTASLRNGGTTCSESLNGELVLETKQNGTVMTIGRLGTSMIPRMNQCKVAGGPLRFLEIR